MTSLAGNRCLSQAEAAEEVRTVVENILRYHPDPFHVTSRNDFYAVVDKLLERKGDISLTEQFFALAHLSSLIFDAHTQIHITTETPGFKASYPLRFRIFSDGLYIIAGGEAYREAIAKKVVSIGGQSPEGILNRLAHYAFSDHFLRKRVWAELEQAAWPVLIGAPTGSSPNMFLNPHKMVLPYSKFQQEVSQDVYVSVYESDPRAYIAPDIPVALNFEDFANGRDLLLETAKTVNREMMEKTYQGANHLAPWNRKSQQEAVR